MGTARASVAGSGLFLTNVKLQGFKLIIVIHGLYLFQFIV